MVDQEPLCKLSDLSCSAMLSSSSDLEILSSAYHQYISDIPSQITPLYQYQSGDLLTNNSGNNGVAEQWRNYTPFSSQTGTNDSVFCS